MPPPVPIIGGTGAIGFGLALRLSRAGVPVVIGSRRQESADDAAIRLRERVPEAQVEGLENPEAAKQGPIVFVCVPFAGQAEIVKSIAGSLEPGQILVDTTVPLAVAVGGRPSRLLGVPQGSAAQQARELVPDGVEVVSALHTVGADPMADLEHELDEDVPVTGDKKAAKKEVAELLRNIPGLRPVNAGSLEVSRLVEGITPLLISVNRLNKTHAGIKLTNLPEELW
jgi:8-hydroxy-5-deazaflavin:NADPH oxidoreductase